MFVYHVTVSHKGRIDVGRVVALNRDKAIIAASRRYGVPASAISAVQVGNDLSQGRGMRRPPEVV